MKKILLFTLPLMLICFFFCGCEQQKKTENTKQKEFEIMTNFEIAKSQAKINNKPILLVFSGSDWCGWCIKLDNEVFSTPEFKQWAADNVIMMIADFPAVKTLAPELAEQNEKLKNTYGVTGFPTVLLLDAEGKVKAHTGYQRGGAANYISHLEALMK